METLAWICNEPRGFCSRRLKVHTLMQDDHVPRAPVELSQLAHCRQTVNYVRPHADVSADAVHFPQHIRTSAPRPCGAWSLVNRPA